MPIRALYTIKDSPIPLIADMYKKIIVPSISEQSQQAFLEMIAPLNYNFEATDSEEKSIFESWKEVKSQLFLRKVIVKFLPQIRSLACGWHMKL